MMKRKPYFAWTAATSLLFAVLLSGCGLSLAADVTPPPDYVAPAPQATEPAEISTVYPLVPPDLQSGAAIYTEKCAPCHGSAGMADGEMSPNLPSPPPLIGSAEVASQASPAEWFQVVTTGNLQKLMPGFSSSLTDRQRWDVVAYAFRLSVSSADLETGEAVYEKKCVMCHGERGAGDGPETAELSATLEDWTQPDTLAHTSAEDLSAVMVSGRGAMPAFSGLSNEERWGVISYIRTFSLSGAEEAGASAAATPEAETTPEGETTPAADAETPAVGGAITVEGAVSRLDGKTVPAGLEVILSGYDGMEATYKLTTQTEAGGAYRFENVETTADRAFIVQVNAPEGSFSSDILHGQDITGDVVSLPVTILDTTSDISALSADRLHLFFDFTTPGKMQVIELFIISNRSQQVVVPASPAEPALTFNLPEGAENLQFESGEMGERYVETTAGFGDLMAVYPGEGQHQVLFSYDLPYDKQADVNIVSPVPVAAAIVMAPSAGVKVQSASLQEAGERDIQGMSYRLYSSGGLAAGQALDLTISGSGTGGVVASGNLTELYIGLGAFGLVLAAVGVFLYRKQRAANVEETAGEVEEDGVDDTEESLLDAIVTLDEQFQAGALPEEAYRARRDELKARLRALHS